MPIRNDILAIRIRKAKPGFRSLRGFRQVIGWSMAPRIDRTLILDVLLMAV
jgi:hypothetical protein